MEDLSVLEQNIDRYIVCGSRLNTRRRLLEHEQRLNAQLEAVLSSLRKKSTSKFVKKAKKV
jgi:hypothetical protein